MDNNFDIKMLSFLCGRWEGQGNANFPTINGTEYFDEIEYVLDEDSIFYKQKTWYNTGGSKGKTLHMESGYFKTAEGRVTISNSQNNGRMELLISESINLNVKPKLVFTSQSYLNDPRMIKSKREILVDGDILRYEMKMSTTANPGLTSHLISTLKKTA